MGIGEVVETFVKHHLIWVVAVAISIVGVHAWLGEHDARLAAEAKIKVDESQVQVLQQSIAQNNQAIASLQQQMQQRDAANAQLIATLVKQRQAATTPPQQVAVLQSEAKLPEPITSLPNSPDWKLPAVDVAPLFSQVNSGLQAQAALSTCQGDLTDQKAITAKDDSTIADQTKQIALKQDEIQSLKKKPSFWKRVGSTLKASWDWIRNRRRCGASFLIVLLSQTSSDSYLAIRSHLFDEPMQPVQDNLGIPAAPHTKPFIMQHLLPIVLIV